MSSEDGYVCQNHSKDGGSEDEDLEADEDPEAGRYVRAPVSEDVDLECEGQNDDDDTDHQYDDYRIEIDPNRENEILKKQLADMQKVIDELSAGRKSTRQHDVGNNDAEESWNCFRNTQLSQSEGNNPTVRWDQMKPFPKNVAANKMWEEWGKYIENFEIAASLSNATDPVRRTQLLFLSVGEELQGIVRAAKLKPNLNNRNCYTVFKSNIEEHLRSLTDTTAEHEAFTCMQQGKGETVVGFHARLMEKVRLCRYSPSDQERFVRAQLLKGMTNRELAKTSRTFAYETNFIVQSATRDEAYQAEAVQATQTYDGTVNHVRGRMRSVPFKRRSGTDHAGGPQNKQPRLDKYPGPRLDKYPASSRRELCPRCNRWKHRKSPCPALKLKCDECGKFGHFAVVCTGNRVNAMEGSSSSPLRDRVRDTKSEAKEDEVQ